MWEELARMRSNLGAILVKSGQAGQEKTPLQLPNCLRNRCQRRAGFIRLLDGFWLQGTRGLSTMIQSVELDFEVRLLAEAVRRLELRATVTTLSSYIIATDERHIKHLWTFGRELHMSAKTRRQHLQTNCRDFQRRLLSIGYIWNIWLEDITNAEAFRLVLFFRKWLMGILLVSSAVLLAVLH